MRSPIQGPGTRRGLKRHPSLEPFSRDHNQGLIIARRLSSPEKPDAVEQFAQIWKDELMDHFQEEQRLLGPLCTVDELSRMYAEHLSIGRYASEAIAGSLSSDDAVCLVEILDQHIRWEERTLFPAIEKRSTESQLTNLAAQTQSMEERRWLNPDNAVRQRLVKKRNSLT